jgi:hypothetical protein
MVALFKEMSFRSLFLFLRIFAYFDFIFEKFGNHKSIVSSRNSLLRLGPKYIIFISCGEKNKAEIDKLFKNFGLENALELINKFVLCKVLSKVNLIFLSKTSFSKIPDNIKLFSQNLTKSEILEVPKVFAFISK